MTQIKITCINRIFFILAAILTSSTYSTEKNNFRRQNIVDPDATPPPSPAPGISPDIGGPPDKGGGGQGDKNRFTKPTTTRRRFERTTPMRISFEENCDYLAFYCLKAYNTGKLCGRTVYYTYHTFKNYCLLDYVNCMERYEVWQVVHMGECFNVTVLTEYLLYPYDDDYFLDHYYVIEDH